MARVIVLVLAGFGLAGCMSGTGDGLFGQREPELNSYAPITVQVMSKSFTIAGPKGFCVDTGATRDTGGDAFAVLGSCAVISGNPRDAKPRRPAILTASVTPADTDLDEAALDRMVAFFSSEAGLAALARSDNAAGVTVVDLTRDEGLVLVHAEDGDSSGDVAGDYWRGVFGVAGQLVSVTVSGYQAAPLDAKTGAALARSFAEAIRTANPDATRDPDTAGAQTGGNPIDRAGARLATFFNRLL